MALDVDEDIQPWDYIFEYPEFGPGWFVLRCVPDEALDAKDHPSTHLKEDRPNPLKAAFRHFRSPYCKNHNKDRNWAWFTDDEIMKTYSYRGS